MNLLTVIPFNTDNAAQAERLLDCIYWLDGKQPSGSCLLIAESGVHEELKTKVKLAAEVAFAETYMAQLAQSVDVLIASSRIIAKSFKQEWLWLEPDCVPLVKGWREKLREAYDIQARKYLGPHLKNATGDMFLSRIAVYPVDAVNELSSRESLFPMSNKTRLIQELQFDGDESKIRKDAVLLHGDKTGKLIETMIERASVVPNETLKIFVKPQLERPIVRIGDNDRPQYESSAPVLTLHKRNGGCEWSPAPKRRGRPPKKVT